MKLSIALLTLIICATGMVGQKPVVMDKNTETATTRETPARAPETMPAKYEGGVFGYKTKQEGTLVFEDANSRLVFRDKTQHELFSIPYASVSQAFADTQSRRPAAASVISQVPVPYGLNLPAKFIKKKVQYLTLQFYDDQSHVGGTTSFRLANKAVVASAVNELAEKSGLVPRGEIFVRDHQATEETVLRPTRETLESPAVVVENEALSQRVISLPRPIYPAAARAANAVGTVRVSIIVEPDGHVSDAEAISGVRALQDAAVEAARKAVFEPLSNNGQAVKTRAVIAYNFQML